MKEAKLSVSNNIANTTEAHERVLSWKTQAEGRHNWKLEDGAASLESWNPK